MTLSDIPPHRLGNQRIAQKLEKPGDVVAWLGAVQAQDYAGAKWSVGLRMPQATDADIERAIADRQIVRTWPMRGTLHFVAPADVRWLLALCTPRIVARSAPRYRELELDEATFARSLDLLASALEGGNHLIRAEVNALLEQAGIATRDQRSYHILLRASMEGLICFGPLRGKQQTFVLLDEWVPEAKPLDREAALAELTRRYFTGHGPATLQDFVWWCGLPVAEARAGIEAAAPHLVQETIEGKTYWMPPSAPAPNDASPTAHLLPGFDEYLLGYTDRSAVLDPQYADQVNNKNGVFSALVVVDGQAVGTWKRTFKRGEVIVEARPFVGLNEAERNAVTAAANRFGAFVELPVVIPRTLCRGAINRVPTATEAATRT